MSKQITISGQPDVHSGYGQLVVTFALGLKSRGWKVSLRPTRMLNTYGHIPDEARCMIDGKVVPGAFELVVGPAIQRPSPGSVFYTMCESTRPKHEQISWLNQAKRVVVPSSWCQTVFSACGVDRQIDVIPLGVDTEVFCAPRPEASPKQSTGWIFGCAGKITHGANRKGISRIISAFIEAFPTETNVRLEVKLLPDDPMPPCKDKRVIFVSAYLPTDQLADWYRKIDVFVNLATGGFELHPLEAMACGSRVISHAFGGIGEYFNRQNGIVLPHALVVADDAWRGHGWWGIEQPGSLVDAFKKTYANGKPAVQAWEQPVAKAASRFSIARTLDNLDALLSKLAPKDGEIAIQTPIKTVVNDTKVADDQLRGKLEGIIKNAEHMVKEGRDYRDEDCAVLCYLPPEVPPAFILNMQENPPANRMIYFTDAPVNGTQMGETIKIQPFNPGKVLSTAYADRAFLNAVNICLARNITWMLYLETDCRVTNEIHDGADRVGRWDEQIFSEHFKWHNFAIASGTPVAWNVRAWGDEWFNTLMIYKGKYEQCSGIEMAIEPKGGIASNGDQPDLYPNGALGVYHVPSMAGIFADELPDPEKNWRKVQGWDQQIGKRVARAIKLNIFDHVGFQSCQYSGCTSRWKTQEERLAMLATGKVCAIHQVK